MDNNLIFPPENNRNMRYYAVFGNPILHSRSPQIYNSLFARDNINAFYTRIHAETGRAVCDIIRGLGLAGANVTTPLKEDVISFLDRISTDAKRIGAVNTIINTGGELAGYNTDGDGITGLLDDEGLVLSGSRCLMIGAGGAGKSAALGLLNAGADVFITDLDTDKASDYAERIGCGFSVLEEAVKKIGEFNIVVLAIPPGIYPFKFDQIRPGMTIVDANYRSPSKTGILQSLPCKVIKGDGWLIYQAVNAYHLFTGGKADIETMKKGMKEDIDDQNPVIKIIENDSRNFRSYVATDMLVDGRKMDDVHINRIIDEEKSRAFGDKR
jgi:shikimate dehydrogenase